MQLVARSGTLASYFPIKDSVMTPARTFKEERFQATTPSQTSPDYHGKSISGPHLPGADVRQVDKIHRFPNHGPVDPSPLLLLLGEKRGVMSGRPSCRHSGGRKKKKKRLENPRGKS